MRDLAISNAFSVTNVSAADGPYVSIIFGAITRVLQHIRKMTLNMDLVDLQLQSQCDSKVNALIFFFKSFFKGIFFINIFFFIKHTLVYNLSL